jgi:hypothetical protein
LWDEVVLAMASILDVQNKFYPVLVRFLADESLASTLAMDETESAYEYFVSVHGRKRGKKDDGLAALDSHAKNLQPAVSEYIKNSNGAELNRWIMGLPDYLVHAAVQMVLCEVVLDDDFVKHGRLQLLITLWAAHVLRLWTNKLKEEQ